MVLSRYLFVMVVWNTCSLFDGHHILNFARHNIDSDENECGVLLVTAKLQKGTVTIIAAVTTERIGRSGRGWEGRKSRWRKGGREVAGKGEGERGRGGKQSADRHSYKTKPRTADSLVLQAGVAYCSPSLPRDVTPRALARRRRVFPVLFECAWRWLARFFSPCGVVSYFPRRVWLRLVIPITCGYICGFQSFIFLPVYLSLPSFACFELLLRSFKSNVYISIFFRRLVYIPLFVLSFFIVEKARLAGHRKIGNHDTTY